MVTDVDRRAVDLAEGASASGPFSFTMRIYWPEPDALNPLYGPPAIEKVR